MDDAKGTVRGFVILSRIPFLSPGIASIVTGIIIAVAYGHDPDAGLLGMSLAGIALIMLATYYSNEYQDFEGDLINKNFIKFSGGSRAIPDGMASRRTARIAAYASVAVLAAMALAYMAFYFEGYPLLLPMALLGAFCGIFYSNPPFKWSYIGIGEILIGGCYGVLALLSGYYVASRTLDLDMIVIALPASFTIFGVIVANEFPDIDADRAVNKKNLVVRLGLPASALMFSVAMALVYPLMLVSMVVGVDWSIALFGLPVLVLCMFAATLTMKGGCKDKATQTKISAATLIANLLSSLMFVPAVIHW